MNSPVRVSSLRTQTLRTSMRTDEASRPTTTSLRYCSRYGLMDSRHWQLATASLMLRLNSSPSFLSWQSRKAWKTIEATMSNFPTNLTNPISIYLQTWHKQASTFKLSTTQNYIPSITRSGGLLRPYLLLGFYRGLVPSRSTLELSHGHYLFLEIHWDSLVLGRYLEPNLDHFSLHRPQKQLGRCLLNTLSKRFTILELTHTFQAFRSIFPKAVGYPLFELPLVDKILGEESALAISPGQSCNIILDLPEVGGVILIEDEGPLREYKMLVDVRGNDDGRIFIILLRGIKKAVADRPLSLQFPIKKQIILHRFVPPKVAVLPRVNYVES